MRGLLLALAAMVITGLATQVTSAQAGDKKKPIPGDPVKIVFVSDDPAVKLKIEENQVEEIIAKFGVVSKLTAGGGLVWDKGADFVLTGRPDNNLTTFGSTAEIGVWVKLKEEKDLEEIKPYHKKPGDFRYSLPKAATIERIVLKKK